MRDEFKPGLDEPRIDPGVDWGGTLARTSEAAARARRRRREDADPAHLEYIAALERDSAQTRTDWGGGHASRLRREARAFQALAIVGRARFRVRWLVIRRPPEIRGVHRSRSRRVRAPRLSRAGPDSSGDGEPPGVAPAPGGVREGAVA